jgi:hypothetical protein
MASSRGALAVGMLALACASTSVAQDDGAWSPESFNGVWLIEEEQVELRTADGSAPPLLPDAARVYEANRQSRRDGDSYFDRATWCASPGIPRLQLVAHPFEIMVNPLMVGFFYEWNRWARLIEITGANFAVLYPMSFGTASGRFEGETLVIVTRGLMSATVLDSAGMPHSDELVMTETYRLLDGDRLENRIRFEDAATFAAPWETVVTYRRQPGARIREDVCLDRIGRGERAI